MSIELYFLPVIAGHLNKRTNSFSAHSGLPKPGSKPFPFFFTQGPSELFNSQTSDRFTAAGDLIFLFPLNSWSNYRTSRIHSLIHWKNAFEGVGGGRKEKRLIRTEMSRQMANAAFHKSKTLDNKYVMIYSPYVFDIHRRI